MFLQDGKNNYKKIHIIINRSYETKQLIWQYHCTKTTQQILWFYDSN